MAVIPGSVRVGGFIAPTDSTDTYATHDAVYGRGGWHVVTTMNEVSGISVDRRSDGMAVYVLNEEKIYTLSGDVMTPLNAVSINHTPVSGSVNSEDTDVGSALNNLEQNGPIKTGAIDAQVVTDTVLYTVPAGKKAIVREMIAVGVTVTDVSVQPYVRGGLVGDLAAFFGPEQTDISATGKADAFVFMSDELSEGAQVTFGVTSGAIGTAMTAKVLLKMEVYSV